MCEVEMKGINGEDIVVIEDVTPVNSYHATVKKKEQNKVEEKLVEKEFNKEVYVSLLHNYPPIKIFDMEEYQLANGLYGFKPQIDGLELKYIDNGYNEVFVTPINTLIDNIRTIYFRIAEDLFALFGVDKEDSSARRIYGCNESTKTFILLLREALSEYSSFDGRILETRIEWLRPLGHEQFTNLSGQFSLHKYKFEPNFIRWLRCEIDHTKIILPYKTIVAEEAAPNFMDTSKFVQHAASQLYYTRLSAGVVSYICEYPFIYSIAPDGKFSEASAIFELKDPRIFEKVLALTIAKYVKRNLDMIQLPGNLVNYNFDAVISELDQDIGDHKRLSYAIHITNQWNQYNKTK